MNSSMYDQLPEYPAEMNGVNVCLRLIDGLNFRFYWATEALTEQEWHFRPVASSMDMMELMDHIHHLAHVIHHALRNERITARTSLPTFDERRHRILDLMTQCRTQLWSMNDASLAACHVKPLNGQHEFAIWHLINGPLADAFTHVGQITTWRRMAGNPVPAHNPFLGKKIQQQ